MATLTFLQRNESGRIVCTAGSSILPAYRFVVMTAGVIDAAASTDTHVLGSTEEAGAAASADVNVLLMSASGTRLIEAGGIIAKGADVILATGGKVVTSAGSGATIMGKALTASTADGDIIEVAPYFAHNETA